MDAIGYFLQLTTTKRDEGFLNVEEQEVAFSQLCKHQGFRSVATFTDYDSAKPGDRRGYKQLVDYLLQPGRSFTVVALSFGNELASSPKEAVRRLLELEDLGTQVVSLDNDAGDLLDQAIDQWRLRRSQDRLSDRVMNTLRSKAMRGYGLGKTPYGYSIGTEGRLEVVPAEAQVVETIYQMYSGGMGLRIIARHLNDASIPTRRGSRWSVVTVRDVLRNRTYTGTYARFGVRVPGSHQAIISADTFRQVQHKREAGRTGQPASREKVFALSGLAYCGYCQGRMIGVSRTQSWSRKRDGGHTRAQYRYYRCGSRVNQSICSYHTWRAKDLEERVLEELRQRLLLPQAPADPGGMPSQTDVLISLKNRLRSLDGRFQRYLDGAARGALPLTNLRAATFPILRETQRLEQRLGKLEDHPDRSIQHEARWEQQRGSLKELQEQWHQRSPADRQLYLADLLERVTVYDDHLEPTLNR